MRDVRAWLANIALPATPDPRLVHWEASLDEVDGTGVRVALLDSGVCWTHLAFKGSRIFARDFTGEGDLRDRTGHGTANASLLIGQAAGGFRGVVPKCELLLAKVLAQDRHVTARAVADGIRWAVDRGADLLVFPFGTRRADAIIARQVRWATAHRCILLAAAGNRGPDEMLFPASMQEIRSVSGVADDGRVLRMCCAREDVDLLAPGEEVPSITEAALSRRTGSSPAAVLATGLLALGLALVKAARAPAADWPSGDSRIFVEIERWMHKIIKRP